MEIASRGLQSKFDGAKLVLNAYVRLVEETKGDGDAAESLVVELAAVELRYALCTGHLFIRAAMNELDKTAAADEYVRTIRAEDFGGSVGKIVAAVASSIKEAVKPLHNDKKIVNEEIVTEGRASPAPLRSKPRRQNKAATRGRVADPLPENMRPGEKAARAALQKALDAFPGRGGAPPSAATGDVEAEKPIEYTVCGCGQEMGVDSEKSQLECPGCGLQRDLPGTVFDDAQFYSQEGQKAKSGTFNPNRHFQHWWTRIYASEPEEEIGAPDDKYGERLVERLLAIARRDKKILRFLTVDDMRAMLDETGRTDLNKNAALLMRKCTGVGPPTPSERYKQLVGAHFTRAIEVIERLQKTGAAGRARGRGAHEARSPEESRTNRNYYPYYIGKLLDALLPPDDYEQRRVLFYIYLQSDSTLKADDKDWELICPELGLKPSPTIRAHFRKYRPE